MRPTVAPAKLVSTASATSSASEPVARDRRPVQHEAHERDVHLLLERQVDDARHAAHRLAHALAEPAQRREIVAEDLDGDVRARARQHVVDAVRDRLADRHVRARAASRSRGAAPPATPRAAGPSRASRRRFPPPRRPARARRVPPARCGAPWRRPPAARAGSARRGGRFRRTSPATCRAACWPERQAAFVELGQERRAHARHRQRRPPTRSAADDADDQPRVIERVRQHPREPRLQRAREPAVVPALRSTARRAETRKHSAGVTTIATTSDASSDDDVRERQRRQQPPLDAGQAEDRQEDQHDDDRREDDRGADLERGVAHDLGGWPPLVRRLRARSRAAAARRSPRR